MALTKFRGDFEFQRYCELIQLTFQRLNLTIEMSQVQPWSVGASDEEVDHGTVRAVEEFFPEAGDRSRE